MLHSQSSHTLRRKTNKPTIHKSVSSALLAGESRRKQSRALSSSSSTSKLPPAGWRHSQNQKKSSFLQKLDKKQEKSSLQMIKKNKSLSNLRQIVDNIRVEGGGKTSNDNYASRKMSDAKDLAAGIGTGNDSLFGDASGKKNALRSAAYTLRALHRNADREYDAKHGSSFNASTDWNKSSKITPYKKPAPLVEKPMHEFALTNGLKHKQKKFIPKALDLRDQYSCLDLVTTSFSQLIVHMSKSRPQLSQMLGRIRDTYRHLFQRLLDNMVDIQAEYKYRTKECKDKYDQTRMLMDAQLEDLQSRLRILAEVSTSKDEIIRIHQDNESQLGQEINRLRQILLKDLTSLVREEALITKLKKRKKQQHKEKDKDRKTGGKSTKKEEGAEGRGIGEGDGDGDEKDSYKSAALALPPSELVAELTRTQIQIGQELQSVVSSFSHERMSSEKHLEHMNRLLGEYEADDIADGVLQSLKVQALVEGSGSSLLQNINGRGGSAVNGSHANTRGGQTPVSTSTTSTSTGTDIGTGGHNAIMARGGTTRLLQGSVDDDVLNTHWTSSTQTEETYTNYQVIYAVQDAPHPNHADVDSHSQLHRLPPTPKMHKYDSERGLRASSSSPSSRAFLSAAQTNSSCYRYIDDIYNNIDGHAIAFYNTQDSANASVLPSHLNPDAQPRFPPFHLHNINRINKKRHLYTDQFYRAVVKEFVPTLSSSPSSSSASSLPSSSTPTSVHSPLMQHYAYANAQNAFWSLQGVHMPSLLRKFLHPLFEKNKVDSFKKSRSFLNAFNSNDDSSSSAPSPSSIDPSRRFEKPSSDSYTDTSHVYGLSAVTATRKGMRGDHDGDNHPERRESGKSVGPVSSRVVAFSEIYDAKTVEELIYDIYFAYIHVNTTLAEFVCSYFLTTEGMNYIKAQYAVMLLIISIIHHKNRPFIRLFANFLGLYSIFEKDTSTLLFEDESDADGKDSNGNTSTQNNTDESGNRHAENNSNSNGSMVDKDQRYYRNHRSQAAKITKRFINYYKKFDIDALNLYAVSLYWINKDDRFRETRPFAYTKEERLELLREQIKSKYVEKAMNLSQEREKRKQRNSTDNSSSSDDGSDTNDSDRDANEKSRRKSNDKNTLYVSGLSKRTNSKMEKEYRRETRKIDTTAPVVWIDSRAAQRFHELIFHPSVISLPGLASIKKILRVWLVDNMRTTKHYPKAHVPLQHYLLKASTLWSQYLRVMVHDAQATSHLTFAGRPSLLRFEHFQRFLSSINDGVYRSYNYATIADLYRKLLTLLYTTREIASSSGGASGTHNDRSNRRAGNDAVTSDSSSNDVGSNDDSGNGNGHSAHSGSHDRDEEALTREQLAETFLSFLRSYGFLKINAKFQVTPPFLLPSEKVSEKARRSSKIVLSSSQSEAAAHMPSALTKGKLGLHMKWAKSISEVEEEEEKQKDQKKVKEKGANNNVNDKTDCGSETDAESGHISNAKAQLQLELQAMLANQKQLMSQLKLMAGKLSSTGDGAASVQHMVDHVTSTIINLKKKLKVQV